MDQQSELVKRKIAFDDPNQKTEAYLARPVDSRMLNIIDKYLKGQGYQSVLDLGCGSGLYGKPLKAAISNVVGLDNDPILCTNAEKTGAYSKVYCDDIFNVNKIEKVDAVFCSEVFEHMQNDTLPGLLRSVESVTKKRIVITVPNPLSPHFKHDPTHTLKYSVYSLLSMLNRSDTFRYKVYPIGFSDYNRQKLLYRLINPIALSFSIFSPTLLYVGNS